ncbi:MAG: hypothetical protein Q8P41_22600 [Pseudomonadota bacterium]|nr:hypothetical protein [Pseudomonadota bacterium]
MLNLSDPAHVEGFDVYRDDEQPHVFYVMPKRPWIPLGEDGAPEFLMIYYIRDLTTSAPDEETHGGYVQLRCSLAIPEDDRARITAALRARLVDEQAKGIKPFGLPITRTDPVLAPPRWTKAEVQIASITLAADVTQQSARAVGSPDPGGDLAVSIVANLRNEEADLFAKAIDPEATGGPSGEVLISIGYTLECLARASAITLEAHAKRETIETELWSKAIPHKWEPTRRLFTPMVWPMLLVPERKIWLVQQKALGHIVHACIGKRTVVTTLKTTAEIVIKSGEGSTAEGNAEVRKAVIDAACELLSNQLVNASLEPPLPEGSVDGADDTQHPLSTATPPNMTYDLTLQQDEVIKLPRGPNGPLDMLLTPEQLRSCFKRLNLADGYFAALDVLVTCKGGVDFESDGIAAILVRLRYDQVDDIDTQRFTPNIPVVNLGVDAPEARRRWAAVRRAGGGFKRAYSYQVEIHYKTNLPSATTAWIEVPDGDTTLWINPQRLSALRVKLELYPTDRVESVRVNLAHVAATGDRFETVKELTREKPQATWFQYTGDPQIGIERPRWRYRTEWRLKDAGTITEPEVDTERDDVVVFSTPFAAPLVYSVLPQGFDATVQSISGTLTYRHEARGYQVTRTFQFTSATAAASEIKLESLHGGPTTAEVAWRVVFKDNTTRDGTTAAEPGVVYVGPARAAVLHVEVVPLAVDWDTDVELALVRLHYVDGANGLDVSKTFQFGKRLSNTTATQTWELGLADAARTRFSYVIDYITYDRARRATVEVRDTADSLVLLDRPAPPAPTPAPPPAGPTG